MDQPLRQGARPSNSPAEKYPYQDEDEPQTPGDELVPMSYRRADGTERRRRLPMAV